MIIMDYYSEGVNQVKLSDTQIQIGVVTEMTPSLFVPDRRYGYLLAE